jgi:hypothetical protein
MLGSLDNLAVCGAALGTMFVFAAPAIGSESAIPEAIRSGTPKEIDAAPTPGMASRSVNQLINLTKAEEKLIVDKLFPLASA